MRESKHFSQLSLTISDQVSSIFSRLKQSEIDGISISIPGFLSINIKPGPSEIKIAKELIIRLSDKRVLTSIDCCRSCRDHSVESLLEIRRLLVEKQVELLDSIDGSLYGLIEVMREGIAQYISFTESDQYDIHIFSWHDKQAPLNILREYLFNCLYQIAKIANIPFPVSGMLTEFKDEWTSKNHPPSEPIQIP